MTPNHDADRLGETRSYKVLAPGTLISHYRIIEKVGEGGMGVVYKAADTKLNRTVALKFLPPRLLCDAEAKERFEHEARAASAPNHPSIATIYEIDEVEDHCFISMEYLEGGSLRDLLRDKELSIKEILDLALQIGEGLSAAHESGAIHRDIKPDNIMLTKRSLAKITDFGLAKLKGLTRLTKEGTTLGTLQYMSPEQVQGRGIDHRSDIFSFGAVLYEMVTGQLPFKGDNEAAVIHSILTRDPEPVGAHRRDLPREMGGIIAKALAKDVDSRYQGVEDMLTDLLRVRDTLAAKKSRDDRRAVEHRSSIAVLPFTNMSADSEQEYFCDGMAEEIINSLTHIKDLRVIARTSSFAFKDRKEDIREIGRKLDVETLLEGSVRKSGNRLRITAQLINAADGSHLWAERYDRNMRDIFDIQDEISLAIVDKLKVKLFGREKDSIAKRYTDDIEAYNLYLKGIHSWRQMTAKGLEEAIDCFQEALQKDPNYALAYDGLASIEIVSTLFSNVPPHDGYPRAREYAQKALEIDKALGEAHATLGFIHTFYDWNWREAEKEFQQALELSPNNAENHIVYSQFLAISERHEVAILEANRAHELDPLSSYINGERGFAFLNAGQFDRAIEELRKALKIDPDYHYLHFYLGYCYVGKSMFEQAIEEFEKAVELSGKAHICVMSLAITYYEIGKKVEAEKLFESLEERSKDEYVPPICFFCIHLVQDEKDEAFEWLERACKERDSFLPWMRIIPVDIFRIPDEPTYRNLLKKYGLE